MAAKDKYQDIIQGGSTALATGRLQNIKTIFPVGLDRKISYYQI